MVPVMDVNLANPPKGVVRTVDGRRDIEEWGLKVQKMASVHSVTLVFVSSSSTLSSPSSLLYLCFACHFEAFPCLSQLSGFLGLGPQKLIYYSRNR